MIKIGLDNGIILYTNRPIDPVPAELRGRIPEVQNANHTELGYEYGICYWRGCENIRRNISEELYGGPRVYCAKDELDIGDVKAIWHVIDFLNRRHIWDQIDNDSMWTYNEIHDMLDDDLLYLEWLIYFMKNNECRVDFYDSY